MSGRGKGGKVKGKAKSRSSRAGLQFPVGRIHRLLRSLLTVHVFSNSKCLEPGRETTPSELELVRPSTWQRWWSIWLQRSWSWLVTLPGTTRSLASFRGIYSLPSGDWRCKWIWSWVPSYVRNDEELNKLLAGVTIAQGGVLPNIQAVLLPKKSASAKEKA